MASVSLWAKQKPITTMNSLYTITTEQLRINELLEELEGELTPEIEEALIINEDNFLTKSEGYIESIAYFKARAEAAKVRIEEYQRIKRIAENAEKRLKERMQWAMEVLGRDKVEVGLHKMSLRSSQAVNITNEARIPNQYIKVETKIDKESLKRDLKAGLVIEGAELITNKSIQIR
jgi:hypothetical protein